MWEVRAIGCIVFLVFPVDQRFRDEFDCFCVQYRRLVQFWLFVAVSTRQWPASSVTCGETGQAEQPDA